MRITERLNVENGVLLRQLDSLSELLAQQAPPEALAAVAQTIARAACAHFELEERWLYPALEDVIGPDAQRVEAMEAEQREIAGLARSIGAGSAEPETIARFGDVLREHIEKEIHALLPLAEESVPPEELTPPRDWYVEHVYERARRRTARWPERWLG